MTDVELLNQHRNGSDSAFADLVRRHLTWVYGLARRRLGDAHLAEDVAQAVFVLLHRKSPQFTADRAMMSWLYKTARYASDSAARGERRRQQRESKVAMSRPEAAAPQEPAEWQQLAPLLDELIGRLPRADREAILLRYYRDLSLAEVAAEIGVTPDAARKRVERGVEKLRQLAAEKGASVSVAGLAAGLATFVRIPPPAGLVATATVVATAPAGSAMAASTAAIVKGALTMMTTTKLTFVSFAAVAIVLIGGVISGAVWLLPDGQTDSNNVQTPTTAPTTVPAPAAASPPVQYDATGPFPRVAPFAGIRWRGEVPEVQVNGTWYELVAIDDLRVNQIISFQKSSRDPLWRKHFGEDMVEVLSHMHHPIGDTINLQVRTLDANKTVTMLQNVPMTHENREALMVMPASDQTVLFSAIRWQDAVPQVQINGTWYELVSVEREPARRLVDSAKSAYGDDWQNQFQKNLMDVLKHKSNRPIYWADLQLRTLDNNEQVMLTIQVPQPN